ncbi:MAG TPA: transcriptional regulator, partial [Gammaproteobacteria bacterium]|nr:transcriptional regulator [Gammaproteobacteria bacterium]
MRKDSRLSRILHVLVHLKHFDRPATSEEMGKMMQT